MPWKSNKIKRRKSKKIVDKNKTVFVSNNFFANNKALIGRIAFTIAVLLFIRFGSYLTVPGVTLVKNKQIETSQQFFSLLSLLGGGTLGKFSILALGVSPYITASIIVQLLQTDVVPILARWSKSGAKGRKKLDRLTKVLTIPFALMQGVATIFTLQAQGVIQPKWNDSSLGSGPALFYYFLVPLSLLAGTMFMLWLADQITVRGVGNGLSVIIFGGIVSRLPLSIQTTFNYWISGKEASDILFAGIVKFMVYIVAFLVVIMFVVILNESERRLPIQQTGSGLARTEQQNKPYLPLKVNSAGVIPVIFSSALISAPVTIAQILKRTSPTNGFVVFTDNYLSFQTWSGIVIYGVLTILFTFLYAQVQINPLKISENFQKSGTFIPGVRPGRETEKYIAGTVARLSVIGSFFLAAIAVLPYIIGKLTSLPTSLAIGGTGIIIMVSVALQTMRQIRGRMTQQSFIRRKKQSILQGNDFSSFIW